MSVERPILQKGKLVTPYLKHVPLYKPFRYNNRFFIKYAMNFAISRGIDDQDIIEIDEGNQFDVVGMLSVE